MRAPIWILAALSACGGGTTATSTTAEPATAQADATTEEPAEPAPAPAPAGPPTPLRAGLRIDCAALLTDVDAFGAALEQPVELHQLAPDEQEKRHPGQNAICDIRRAGKMTPEAEDEMRERVGRGEPIGVLPGDRICSVDIDCSQTPPDDFAAACKKMFSHRVDRELGLDACLLVSQRAASDAYSYKLFEPDTGCFLQVVPGSSVTGKEAPLACARLAIDQMTAAALAPYRAD